MNTSKRSKVIKVSSALLAGVTAVMTCAAALAQQPTSALSGRVDQVIIKNGRSQTLLPDGRWMFMGGQSLGNPSGSIFISETPDLSVTAQPIATTLINPRAGHTATVLPDGTVLVLGGVGANGELVTTAELFDPSTQGISALPDTGLQPRVGHTATLLTNGLILVAGGTGKGGAMAQPAELLNPKTFRADITVAPLGTPRSEHSAALLANGKGLLWGGKDAKGGELNDGELYDPALMAFTGAKSSDDPHGTDNAAPKLEESVPTAGATDVPVDSTVAVRFNKPLDIKTINTSTVTLVGPAGAVTGKAIAAEAGMLAFFTPATDLSPDTTYTLFLSGIADGSNRALQFTSFSFTTHRFTAPSSASQTIANAAARSASGAGQQASGVISTSSISTAVNKAPNPAKDQDKKKEDESESEYEDWIPQEENRHGAWKVLGLAKDPILRSIDRSVADLAAGKGVTAVSGRVLRLNGRPIVGVAVSVGSVATVTDAAGRFLLAGVPDGLQQLKVDGTVVVSGGRHYTKHFIQLKVAKGKTTPVSEAIYLPRVNPASEIAISSPADQEIVLTHPAMPGLEVRIPKGAVLREYDGKIVTKLSITPIPVNRAPYPAPIEFSTYFTLQPGGAFVEGDPEMAVKIIYPNYPGLPANSVVDFWNYDPAVGWKVYGHGKVSADGKKVVPDSTVGFRQVMTFGWGFGPGNTPPATGPNCDCLKGDPVDVATGLFLHRVTDFSIQDIIPIKVTRTYRPNDNVSHAFGVGANLSYGMYLYTASGATVPPQIDLVQENGGRIHYTVTSDPSGGTDITSATWTNLDSPTSFRGSTLKTNAATSGSGIHTWKLTLRDGTFLSFSPHVPNQLQQITDRSGNQLVLTLSNGATGNITQVSSPSGRFVQFSYDGSNRITQATDNTGRTVRYTYDASGRLSTVTDQDNKIERYTYGTANRMTVVTDKRNNAMVTNVYDANGRVSQQTLADGAVWQFAYTQDANGNVTQADVTDPRGNIERESFNASGFLTQQTRAFGQALQQTYVYQRDSTNLVTSITDPLNRQTTYTYDGFGDVTSVTLLAGTPNAVTYSYTYSPTYHRLKTATDPLGHITQASYDSVGNLLTIADALNHTTTVSSNEKGLPTTVTDPLGHATQFAYRQADLSQVTDALGRASSVYTDALGRVLSATDPLGNKTQYAFDALDRTSTVTDALSGVTNLTYDNNGNVLTVVDPRNTGTHGFNYDLRNRKQGYTDPLGKSEIYGYDGLSNLTSFADRKNQQTTYAYDALNRLHVITFQDGATITLTWDAGNRLSQIVDSANGTISRQYDDLNRLTQETTPEGQVSYVYDAANRRTQMTVAGQASVNYTYDDANRLTQIQQGSSTVVLGYDNANRRTSMTLPNGVVGAYAYDNANQLTSLTYTNGATTLGTLNYGYDTAGRRTTRTSSLDQSGQPAAVTNSSYNAANRLSQWAGQTLTYDDNGNLLSDGVNTYTWNARNQLVAISGGATASFSYDALGRRRAKTINSASTSFLYDGQNLTQELTAGSPTANYLTGLSLDEVFSRSDSGGSVSYVTDALGSVVGLSDASGAIATGYGYGAYGSTATTGNSSANPIQYAGRENDGTGLYFNRARYYSPTLQRFISSDPIGLAGGINTYAYVSGSPTNYVDPSGMLLDEAGTYLGAGTRTVTTTIGVAVAGILAAIWPSELGSNDVIGDTDGECGCDGNKNHPDLFRSGNSSGPRIDNVRPQDIPVVGGLVSPGTGGVSSFDSMPMPGKWWKFPKGAPVPPGICLVNDRPGHWSWEPAHTMPVDIYKSQLQRTTPSWTRVQ